jgi:hypothetical protein
MRAGWRVALAFAFAFAFASPAARADGPDWAVRPFADIVGGVEVETLQTLEGDDREDRVVTLALSRFGLRADLGYGVTAESEFEANAGPHGSSAWEGQAALSVRNQLIRLVRGRFVVEAGRITDPSSVDFYSEHVLDQLLTDGYTRGPLLASGFNRGNGVQGRFRAYRDLWVGLNLNAANPVSTTQSLVVGGTFPPFSRFYFAPYQYVGRDAANFPADEYHIIIVTPSAAWRSPRFEAQVALQLFEVNTNTSSSMDQKIHGYNVRGGLSGRFLDDRVHAFFNASMVQNEVVDPDDGTRLSGEIFTGISASGGVDVAIRGRNGVGMQVAWVHDQQGDATAATQIFANVGGTLWLGATTAVAARFALYSRCEDQDGTGCEAQGERSFFMTLRTHL